MIKHDSVKALISEIGIHIKENRHGLQANYYLIAKFKPLNVFQMLVIAVLCMTFRLDILETISYTYTSTVRMTK